MPFGIPFDIRHIIPTEIFAYLIIGVYPYYNFANLIIIGILSRIKYTIVVLK